MVHTIPSPYTQIAVLQLQEASFSSHVCYSCLVPNQQVSYVFNVLFDFLSHVALLYIICLLSVVLYWNE